MDTWKGMTPAGMSLWVLTTKSLASVSTRRRLWPANSIVLAKEQRTRAPVGWPPADLVEAEPQLKHEVEGTALPRLLEKEDQRLSSTTAVC